MYLLSWDWYGHLAIHWYHHPVAVTVADNCLYVMKGQRFACYLNSVTNDSTSSISWLGLTQQWMALLGFSRWNWWLELDWLLAGWWQMLAWSPSEPIPSHPKCQVWWRIQVKIASLKFYSSMWNIFTIKWLETAMLIMFN